MTKIREHSVIRGLQDMDTLKARGKELIERRIVAEHGQPVWDQVKSQVQYKNEQHRQGFNYVTVMVDTEV